MSNDRDFTISLGPWSSTWPLLLSSPSSHLSSPPSCAAVEVVLRVYLRACTAQRQQRRPRAADTSTHVTGQHLWMARVSLWHTTPHAPHQRLRRNEKHKYQQQRREQVCSQKTATPPSLENRCSATSCSPLPGKSTTENSDLFRLNSGLAAPGKHPTPTWCRSARCPRGSRRDGASGTRVPLDCREQSPSCHHTSTLGKRALEEISRVIQLQQSWQGQFSCPSALGVFPASVKSGKAMPWWEQRNCPPFVKMEATIAAQGLPSLLQSCSSSVSFQWDTFAFDQVFKAAQDGIWQQTETNPTHSPCFRLCYCHPCTQTELERKNLLRKANHVREKGSLEDKGKEQNKMRVQGVNI